MPTDTDRTSTHLPRIKWHKLRRSRTEAPVLRSNLDAALVAGAACEVDVRITADGHAVCLHDAMLDRETTGRGRVSENSRASIERLRQRDETGTVQPDPPLFLDELAACVRSYGDAGPARVQLDVKAPVGAWTNAAIDRISNVLGDVAQSCVVSAYDWRVVRRWSNAVPGLHAGFDPLELYPRSLELSPAELERLTARTLAVAPGARIYYLEARLVLVALARGVNLIREHATSGAEIDVWTIDADRPGLSR